MSVSLYRNCPTCGQPYAVNEETNNVALVMNGMVVLDCIICETPLPEAKTEETVKPMKTPTYATTKVFKEAGDGR